jgi:hypothetical protein
VREQAVSRAEIDDAAAAEEAPHASRHLPRFVQLFARQAAGFTHRARESIEERVAGEASEVVVRQPRFRRERKPFSHRLRRVEGLSASIADVQSAIVIYFADLTPRFRACFSDHRL